MIRISGLRKCYGDVVALDDVDLSVGRGRTMGLIGPNGSGKTTLLRMISTLAKPECGSVHVCGFDAISSPREVRRRMNFMPAEASAPLDMNIGEYLQYFACASGVTRRDRHRAVGEVLDLTDLAGREDEAVRSLSTGNRQRVLLAKTLLGDPDLLILDEPASGLDPRARIEVREFLQELAAMGKTIIISSHILADVESICSDICILESGRLKVADSIENLRSSYSTPHLEMRLRVDEASIDSAVGLISRNTEVVACTRRGDWIEISISGTSPNALLHTLISSKIEIRELMEERPDLEDIFMDSTKGIVS
jgi:ABC-2 type transport system ATP-binding protein